MKIAKTVAFAAGLALTATASAQTLQFSAGAAGPFDSAGAIGDAGNGSFSFNYAGAAFTVGDIVFTGDLTDGGVGTWGSEASVAVTNPGGIVGTVALGSGTTFAGTVAVGPNTITGGGGLWGNDVVGTWNFEFFESFDDAGIDATWTNVNFDFYDFAPVGPPASTFVGANPNNMQVEPIGQSEVLWYSFDLTDGAGALPWSISTAGSTNTGGSFGDDDTEIGLYDAAGNLIATNDDEDFGAGILTSLLDDSTVGALADGTYYVAVGNFNTVYNAGFDATSTSTAEGTSKVTFSFVPAPSSVALLGLGGLAAIRRRR
ncbi:MAG: PEP-CTERM sorting domain-containing protein [Phycisphaerales bacterium]|nr:PEP-CTERM sorting domain-containing protein [Phycisphaerales bacterium]MCB9835746.1 PEP-CTERM sorting domain-containing protein [Phycisphaera sp.]